jgi:DNA-binding IclR family transcriptional regulator
MMDLIMSDISSIIKAVNVLNEVASSRGGLRPTEIADALGVKLTAAHNIIKTLVSCRMLEKSPDAPVYCIGPNVADIYAKSIDNDEIRLMRTKMQKLASVKGLGKAVLTWSQISGGEIRVRLRLAPENNGIPQAQLSSNLNLYSNATGLVALAYCSTDRIEELRFRYPFHEYGARLWKDHDELGSYIKSVREKGYAVLPFSDEKFIALAVPLLGNGGGLASIFGVKTPADKGTDEKKLHEILREVISERN